MSTKRIVIPYTPRPFQKQIHGELDAHRWNVLVMHRRFGKTVMLINHLIKASMMCSLSNPRFHYCAPFLKQGKAVAWSYIKQFSNVIPGIQYNEAELRCDFPNGARIMIIGADNAEGHRGIYSDGTVFDEYGNTDPEVFTSIFRPALSDRNGWAVFAGTPNGRNHFYELLVRAEEDKTDKWYSKILRASETGVLTEEELEDARFIMSEEEYEREYECSFVSGARGAYYAKQLRKAEQDGRITHVPYDTAHEVYTFWDLGVDDSTSIWFLQAIGKELRFIDYYENCGEGMVHYAKILKERGYNYGDHYMPHDAASKSVQTGMTTKAYAESMGINPISVVTRAKDKAAVLAGIESGRNIISQCVFDKKKCSRGLSALESYQAEWNESKKKLGDGPLHDWTSHACLPAETKILLSDGYKNIEDIKIGEFVKLPTGELGEITNSGISGFTDVLIKITLSSGKELTCTHNHTLLTHLGLYKAEELTYNNLILVKGGYLWQMIVLNTKVKNTISLVITTLKDSIASLTSIFTELFGKSRLARSLKDSLSTIKTEIQKTTQLKTLNVCTTATTPSTTLYQVSGNGVKEISQKSWLEPEKSHISLEENQKTGNVTQKDGKKTQNCKSGLGLRGTLTNSTIFVRKLQNGMGLQKGCNGIKNMRNRVGKLVNQLKRFVPFVILSTVRFILLGLNSAEAIVKKEHVRLEEIKPVYNLTIKVHNCYIAEGMLVSNSDAFRTFSVGYAPKKPKRSVSSYLNGNDAIYAGVW